MSKTRSAKPDTNVSFRTSIGGQALIEGILMRGPEKQAIVCRTEDGLVEKVDELHLVKEKHPILGWPLIRGVVVFLDSMVKGMQALTYSADLLPLIAPKLLDLGLNVNAIHRIACFAATTLDSMPYSGAILMLLPMCRMKLKEIYPPMFITTVIATTCGTIAVIVMCALFPGLC